MIFVGMYCSYIDEHRHILVYVVTCAAPEFPEFLISEYYRTGSSVEYTRIRALFGTE